MNIVRAAIFSVATFFLAAACASAAPKVTITLAQATVVTAPDGISHIVSLGAKEPLARGTLIRYTITAKEVGTDAARRLTLTGRIPAGTAFAAGSLRTAGGHTDFSIDGRHFWARPMIAQNTSVGTVFAPADAALYVLVRWTKDAPLAPFSSAVFSYDVTVK